MARLKTIMIWVAGSALITAALLNLFAVIGRHTGLLFKGSIELVQVSVLVAGSLSLIAATLGRNHARVHLVLDRLSDRSRAQAERFCTGLSILFYAALLAGSCWLAADLWHSQEVSELIGVPWRWMRLFLNAALLIVLVLLARQLVERRR